MLLVKRVLAEWPFPTAWEEWNPEPSWSVPRPASGETSEVEAGIIDPTMVTRSALQNAASIAKNILMTEAIVAEPPEQAGAGIGGGMGDMGGMM
jgi:hypothetical protein